MCLHQNYPGKILFHLTPNYPWKKCPVSKSIRIWRTLVGDLNKKILGRGAGSCGRRTEPILKPAPVPCTRRASEMSRGYELSSRGRARQLFGVHCIWKAAGEKRRFTWQVETISVSCMEGAGVGVGGGGGVFARPHGLYSSCRYLGSVQVWSRYDDVHGCRQGEG